MCFQLDYNITNASSKTRFNCTDIIPIFEHSYPFFQSPHILFVADTYYYELFSEPADPSPDCPHQYGYFKIGDQSHCGQFMNCVDGRGYVFDCPEGLAFNPESYRCDWPDQVPDCDAEAFLGFRCPEVKNNFFSAGKLRFYRSVTDCHHYYLCVNGRPRLQNCGEGNAFNELIDTCDAAENVTGW